MTQSGHARRRALVELLSCLGGSAILEPRERHHAGLLESLELLPCTKLRITNAIGYFRRRRSDFMYFFFLAAS
jgi:hypothetical protein